MHIITVVGARPQFIKAATVCRVLREQFPTVRHQLIHTGQHYDAAMSDVFFTELDIPVPDHHLGIGGGTHGQNTGRMLEHLEQVLVQNRPDRVLVYGDTDSTLAGALAAVKLNIPVAHVEAGLRSFNRRMPEEINRILTDHAADLLFTPTATASAHLAHEGIADEAVIQVGDVMYDAALFYRGRAQDMSRVISELDLAGQPFILATVHRAENVDDPGRLGRILEGLGRATIPVILPMHPRTRQRLSDSGLRAADNIRIISPVGYLDMVALEMAASRIATDSGGVQKEAYFHGVPCITLREETEWTELVESGANVLVGTDVQAIEWALNHPLPDAGPDRGDSMTPYGQGNAADLIVNHLVNQI
ncbi:MAG: UDP-N-acetylglucosamine 2-epimerase (non-hydrolyzing) [Proteobacteria bacterium]|nr:UDP-N-acetylglucosamine 2-epimerase (non-hydrolyzing) [Pseudomonadota bacterium]